MGLLEGIQKIDALELEHERVLVRVNFDVNVEGETVVDDARIREALPTLRHAVEKGARVLVASHVGAPKGGRGGIRSLEAAGMKLSELTGWEIQLPDDCIGDTPKKLLTDLRPGQVLLLENLRMHAGEDKDDDAFANRLAELCDVYVNESFSLADRRQASLRALPRMVRQRAAGFRFFDELTALDRVAAGERPMVAVLGGAKASDKIPLITALLPRIDVLAVAGGVANTFLAAQGRRMAGSPIESDKLALVRTLLEKARGANVEVLLPTDVVVATSPEASSGDIVDLKALQDRHTVLDVGPRTVERFAAAAGGAKTVFWNGPLGVAGRPELARGTESLGRALSRVAGFVFAAGEDTERALRTVAIELAAGRKHVSTGGPAVLAYLEGKRLPAVEALRTAPRADG